MGPVGSQRLREPCLTGPPDRSAVTSFSFDSCQLEEVAAAVTGAAHDQGAPIFSDSGE